MPVSYGDLWDGCVLGGIAHAIAVAKFPDLSNEQSWDGLNYSVQDSQGSRGTVAFGANGLVGALFWLPSGRSPDASKGAYPLEQALAGLPDELHDLAYNEALQYLLQEVGGRIQPVLTTAFWCVRQDGEAVSSDDWETLMGNGGQLIEAQQMPVPQAIQRWSMEYEYTATETQILEEIFELRRPTLSSKLKVGAKLSKLLRGLCDEEEGVESMLESFAEMNVIIA